MKEEGFVYLYINYIYLFLYFSKYLICTFLEQMLFFFLFFFCDPCFDHLQYTFSELHNYDVCHSKILELFLRHSKNKAEFSKNKSLKSQILRKKSCFDQIL